MDTQENHWLPLTEYALRSGMSISTLRRKIKSNTISYKMVEGRYLIRWDQEEVGSEGFASSDDSFATAIPKKEVKNTASLPKTPEAIKAEAVTKGPLSEWIDHEEELVAIRRLVDGAMDENSLRWRALEARVSGLAKKMDMYIEHMAELKMLVKLFEEKLDRKSSL